MDGDSNETVMVICSIWLVSVFAPCHPVFHINGAPTYDFTG